MLSAMLSVRGFEMGIPRSRVLCCCGDNVSGKYFLCNWRLRLFRKSRFRPGTHLLHRGNQNFLSSREWQVNVKSSVHFRDAARVLAAGLAF